MRRIPEVYDHSLGPLFFRPFAREMANLWRVEGTVLDLASGTGILTKEILRSNHCGTTIAVDKSESMLRFAQSKVRGAHYVRSAAERLPFAVDAVDAAFCGFGLMFFVDLDEALIELHRVLKPGGTFRFSVWDELHCNEAACVADRVAGTLTGLSVPFQLPFSLGNPEVLEIKLNAAQFADVRLNRITLANDPVSAQEAAIGLFEGNPIRNKIDPGMLPHLVEAVATELASEFGDPVVSNLAAWVGSAIKPG